MKEGYFLMEPAPCLLLLLLWGYCLAVIDGEGELRCYCNESGCVSTGYMCKSPLGQCYTAVEVQGETTRATHGCLDSVPPQQRGLCGAQLATTQGPQNKGRHGGGEHRLEGEGRHHHHHRQQQQHQQQQHHERQHDGGAVREVMSGEGRGAASSLGETDPAAASVTSSPGAASAAAASRFPLLICCGEDMCNYIENIDFSSIATLTRNMNGSLLKGPGGERGVIYSRNGPRGEGEDKDLWFKAAVIAVPIAGGFILVLLVLLAVRMLRTDTQRHRRLIQVRRERSLTKAQLYVTDHFSSSGGDAPVEPGTSSPGKGQGSCPLNLTAVPPPVHHPLPAHPPFTAPFPPPPAKPTGTGGEHVSIAGLKVPQAASGLTRVCPGVGSGSGGNRGMKFGLGFGVNISTTAGGGGGGAAGVVGPGMPVRRDVSISLDREGRLYEQCDVSVHQTTHHLLPSLVKWGSPRCPPDGATKV